MDPNKSQHLSPKSRVSLLQTCKCQDCSGPFKSTWLDNRAEYPPKFSKIEYRLDHGLHDALWFSETDCLWLPTQDRHSWPEYSTAKSWNEQMAWPSTPNHLWYCSTVISQESSKIFTFCWRVVLPALSWWIQQMTVFQLWTKVQSQFADLKTENSFLTKNNFKKKTESSKMSIKIVHRWQFFLPIIQAPRAPRNAPVDTPATNSTAYEMGSGKSFGKKHEKYGSIMFYLLGCRSVTLVGIYIVFPYMVLPVCMWDSDIPSGAFRHSSSWPTTTLTVFACNSQAVLASMAAKVLEPEPSCIIDKG